VAKAGGLHVGGLIEPGVTVEGVDEFHGNENGLQHHGTGCKVHTWIPQQEQASEGQWWLHLARGAKLLKRCTRLLLVQIIFAKTMGIMLPQASHRRATKATASCRIRR